MLASTAAHSPERPLKQIQQRYRDCFTQKQSYIAIYCDCCIRNSLEWHFLMVLVQHGATLPHLYLQRWPLNRTASSDQVERLKTLPTWP